MPYKLWYKRRLPHWQPGGVPIFITWRLAGSLPQTVLAQFDADRQRIANDARAKDIYSDWAITQHKRVFSRWDDELHKATGLRRLMKPKVAQCVQEALHQGVEEALFLLYAYTIMGNHVHVLLHPLEDPKTEHPVPLARITQLLKGRTASGANQILQRTGQRFWARESYDHWSRNEHETRRIIAYIVNNPVKAGLVDVADDWPWSWAAEM